MMMRKGDVDDTYTVIHKVQSQAKVLCLHKPGMPKWPSTLVKYRHKISKEMWALRRGYAQNGSRTSPATFTHVKAWARPQVVQ